jgi:hypothetical protein
VEGRDDRDVQEDGNRQDVIRGHGSSKCVRAFGDVWRRCARRKQSARQEEVSVKDGEVEDRKSHRAK